MCSVKQKTWKFLAMANWMISSRESFAWPGQNCPEWLWWEKGMTALGLFRRAHEYKGDRIGSPA
jgi:hypothetical protein